MKLSKTDYISWRDCKKNVWVKWHLPLEFGKYEVSEFEKSLAVLGNEVGEQAEQLKDDMLEYCKLDTYAMVRIWQELEKLVQGQ